MFFFFNLIIGLFSSGGETNIRLLASFILINSSKVSMMDDELKFVEKLSGKVFIIIGGCISLSPPEGGIIFAQVQNKSNTDK